MTSALGYCCNFFIKSYTICWPTNLMMIVHIKKHAFHLFCHWSAEPFVEVIPCSKKVRKKERGYLKGNGLSVTVRVHD